MRILKEAYTEHTKVVVAPEYVTLEHHPVITDQEVIHLSRQEAQELVLWLSGELNRVLPEVIQMKKVDDVFVPMDEHKGYMSGELHPIDKVAVAHNRAGAANIKKQEPTCDYQPGDREAKQTVPLVVGDPFLVYRTTGGRTGTAGDGEAAITDLGALAEKVGHV